MPDPDDVSSAAERSASAAHDDAPTGAEPTPGVAPPPQAMPEAAPAEGPPAEAPAGTAAAAAEPSGAAPSPGSTQPTPPSRLASLPWWTVPAILVGVPLLVAVATQAVPDLYEDVVWKYYWGPIEADGSNDRFRCFDSFPSVGDDEAGYRACVDGGGTVAESGYNVVNTATWAVLLGVCILGIAQMLAAFRTPMDDKLILGAAGWVVVGSLAHVLEDVDLFRGALQFFFITPPIYLLFGAFGVASFLVGQWMRSVAARSDLHAALRLLWILHMVAVLLWLGLWLADWPLIAVYVNPAWVALFAAANFLLARWVVLRQGRVDPSLLTLVLGSGAFLLVMAYLVTYVVDPWNAIGGDGMPTAFLLAPALAAAVAGLVFLAARHAPKVLLGILLVGGSLLAGIVAVTLVDITLGILGVFGGSLSGARAVAVAVVAAAATGVYLWRKHGPEAPVLVPLAAAAYALAINLVLVFSQMVDGFATALGIDLIGYEEKQVLSARVIDSFREFAVGVGWGFGETYATFLSFVPVKFLVSLLVVYAIDIHSREDARQNPTMIGLVKFAIIMVGLGPGVRDFTRMSLGV